MLPKRQVVTLPPSCHTPAEGHKGGRIQPCLFFLKITGWLIEHARQLFIALKNYYVRGGGGGGGCYDCC